MNVFEAIQTRREITHFQKKPILSETLEQVLNSAYLSPAGNNLPSREFIAITNQDMLQHLAHSYSLCSLASRSSCSHCDNWSP